VESTTGSFCLTCACGHSIAIAGHRQKTRRAKSFGVIADRDFKKFITHEVDAANATSEDERLKSIARASRFITSLYECPNCSRLLHVVAEGHGTEKKSRIVYYQREADSPLSVSSCDVPS
jgi:hypothetical protein